MNSSTNSSQLAVEYMWMNIATYIINNYLIRVVCCLGIVFNFFFAFILRNKKLTHRIYNFFWCRAVCNFLVCVLGAANKYYICFDCEISSYWLLFYTVYLNTIPIRIACYFTQICDLMLILNRFFQIMNKKNFLTEMSKKSILLMCVLAPIVISVPFYFSIKIQATASGNFVSKPTELGLSKYFSFYSIIMFILVIILPVVAATVINFVSMYKFRKILESKANLTNKVAECKQAEMKYSICVFILAAICILSRSLDVIATIFNRLLYFFPEIFSEANVRLIVFSKCVTNLFLFTVNGLDGLVYLKMDNNLWQLIWERFKRKTK